MRYTLIVTALIAIAQAASVSKSESDIIPDAYVVLLKDGNTADSFKAKFDAMPPLMGGPEYNLTIGFKYDIFPGFSVTANRAALNMLLVHPDVELVEKDMHLTAHAIQDDPPSWGLSRISNTTGEYTYNDSAGEGITVFVVDSGVNPFHEDLAGRVLKGAGFVRFGNSTDDYFGHGTHVAGTVGGKIYGVAKKVLIAPVKVLDLHNEGSFSSLVAGLDWVFKNALRGKSVVNISIGMSEKRKLVGRAVNRIYNNGIPVFVSAGNDGKDACQFSPSDVPTAYTVGSMDEQKKILDNSNFGTCVKIFAPGGKIKSAATKTDRSRWINLPTSDSYVTSGTSMAAPHVAGVAALFLSVNNTLSAEEVYAKITEIAIKDKMVDDELEGSPNLMLYNNGTILS